jgi:hypothetical protein
MTNDSAVLCWPGRLLSADDLRRHLTSQKEIVVAPRTIVTPLAADELRGRGVRIRREEIVQENGTAGGGAWSYAQETPDALVDAALAAARREGILLTMLPGATPLDWARAVVKERSGAIVFCGDPALVCCVANRVKGVRAAAISSVKQAVQARRTFGANFLAIEVPGRTLFELRQIIRTAVQAAACPADIAKLLGELDGHAHR